LVINRKSVRFQLWDTAGQEREFYPGFRTITSSYYRGAHGVAVVFDVTDRLSFDKVGGWIEEIDRNSADKLLRVLLANKVDSESRRVSEIEGRTLSQRYGMQYYEVSAKTGQGVHEVFTSMAETLVATLERDSSLMPRKSFSLKDEESVQIKQGCCR
jgi:Ras-related protein Rab-1A